MQPNYTYKTYETLPPSTEITVNSCGRCPFMHVEEETQATCTHPEVEGDEPTIGLFGRLIGGHRDDKELSQVQAWCPMRQIKQTTVILFGDSYLTP